MAYNIPMIDSTGNALSKGFTQGSNLYKMLIDNAIKKQQTKLNTEANQRAAELFPLQKMLLSAKTNSAQSNANWNNMLLGNPSDTGNQGNQGIQNNPEEPIDTSAIKQKFPNLGNKSQINNQENIDEGTNLPNENNNIGKETIINPGNPKLSMLDKHAGIKGIPAVQTHYDTNGNLITRFPSGKITMQKIAPSASETKAQEATNTSNNKIIDELQKQNPAILKLDSSFKRFDKLLSDPLWDKMNENIASNYGGEKGRKLSIEYYKNRGTKEQKDLISRLENQSNEIIANMANGFKGPFKLFEKDIIDKMKPQVWDTPVGARAKLGELMRAAETQKYINNRIPQLIRKEKMNSDEAFVKAYDEINEDKFIDNLEKKYGSNKGNEEKLNSKDPGFLKSVSEQLSSVMPDATPELIEKTAKEENKSVEEVVEELIKIAEEMKRNKK